ncbi:30S ribosomal protein S11 [Candidatus Tremblaya phenacola]|uniref:Small ribosomal subunit protein uS11 n=1 Tax=Candidatus Tremblayella phenacoccinincola TaxID=1010676 RepID=A0A2G0V6U6_9PROT|nr:30S ribosomal protein S11 [Candidatus Tremblaya phenacola]PHN16194.1 30S ribosomal protein S11 [Candidatus Tremblaya phenacola]
MYKPKDKQLRPASNKVLDGIAYIHATFNNTIITITSNDGAVLFWSSTGKHGFKGSKKATPFSAQVTADSVGKAAVDYGMKALKVKVNGPGTGRESAIRSLYSSGIKIISLEDVTSIPHNGCRPSKRRRV